MTRFNIEGQILELPSNVSLQFKKSNILFAFDKVECERSTSFSIPDTPQNNRIFGLAKDVASYGNGMRRRFTAQMQDGVVSKDGYLYVDTYNGGNYKAVFVTGELIGLQKIRDLGKISEIVRTDAVVEFGDDAVSPADALNSVWENVRHLRTLGTMAPSSLVRLVSDMVTSQNDIAPVTLPESANGLRIIPSVVKGLTNTPFDFYRMIHPYSESELAIVYDSYIREVVQGSGIDDYFSPVSQTTRTYDSQGNPKTGYVILQMARIDMVLTFPQDFPENYFIVTDVTDGVAEFAGGYSFAIDPTTRQIIRYGEPLAGRDIMIRKDTPFIIVKDTDRTLYGEDYYGWLFAGNFSQRVTARAADEEATSGDIVRLQDNLPDITYVELLKALAGLTGTALYYTDEQGITFEQIDVDQFKVVDVSDKLIEAGEMTRKFADYARVNIVQFDSGENVAARLMATYDVDNDNISSENVLQTIPFSEGDIDYLADGQEVLLVRTDEDGKADKDVMADSGAADYLIRCSLMKNATVSRLCYESTAITLRVRMSLMEYEHVTPMTVIYCRGVRYVWTEAQYNNGVVTLKLSKA